MNESHSHNNHTSCWVYLLQDDKSKQYEIGFDLNLPETVGRMSFISRRLVYFRRFDNLLDGIGYKLLLEKISEQSLSRIVYNANPTNRNLLEQLSVISEQ